VVLEQTHLSGEVELEVRDRQILIRSAMKPRFGWAQKFRAMAEKGDDKLLDAEVIGQTSWDKEGWQW
jgi:antitoxin MazE